LVSGGALRIAVDPAGIPWTVDNTGVIRRRVGTTWTVMPGLAKDIGIGADGSVWIVGTGAETGGFQIWRFVNGRWARVPAAATNIAGGPNGTAWIVRSDFVIQAWS
jgi:hypothetical protein